MNPQNYNEALVAAESAYEDTCRRKEEARERVFGARTECFLYHGFEPSSDIDKEKVRRLLLELADETTAYSKYARQQGSLRTIIDEIAKIFGLENKSDDEPTSMYKLPVAHGNDTYGITMTYSVEGATIESRLIEF